MICLWESATALQHRAFPQGEASQAVHDLIPYMKMQQKTHCAHVGSIATLHIV